MQTFLFVFPFHFWMKSSSSFASTKYLFGAHTSGYLQLKNKTHTHINLIEIYVLIFHTMYIDVLISRNSFRRAVRFGAIIIVKGQQRVQPPMLAVMHAAVRAIFAISICNQSFLIIARLQSMSTFKVGYAHEPKFSGFKKNTHTHRFCHFKP